MQAEQKQFNSLQKTAGIEPNNLLDTWLLCNKKKTKSNKGHQKPIKSINNPQKNKE